MSTSLQVLADNRDALLLAEVGALIHDLGKLSTQFIDQMSRTPSIHSDGFEHENAIMQVDSFMDVQFLNKLKATKVRALRWSHIPNNEQIGQFIDLILHHDKSKHSAFLVRLLNRCDGSDSGADKGTTRQDGLPQIAKQEYGKTFIATAFGKEARLDEINLDSARLALTGSIGSLLFPLKRSDLLQEICSHYANGLAETRRSANDVTLWDHSFSVATLYKTALATLLIRGTPLDLNNLRWRILRVNFDVLDLYAKAVKIADLLAYKKAVAGACEAVKQLVEVDYPLGNEVYRDTTGIYFTYPDLDLIPELEQKIRQQVEAVDLELAPRIRIEQSPGTTAVEQLKRLLSDARQQARQDLVQPFAAENLGAGWKSQWENLPEGKWEVCPVCRLRPMQEGKDTCESCEKRRTSPSRVATWQAAPQTTIWMDEIADANGRVALLVGKFGLDDWLSGDLVQTMLVKAVEDNPGACQPKNPSPARLRRVWETCQNFWVETVAKILSENVSSGSRLIVIPDDKTGWRENVPYDGTVDGKAISLLWHDAGQHFVTISNLQWVGDAIKENQEIVVSKPDTPARTHHFKVQGVMPAMSDMGHYNPTLTLLTSPDRCLALVPAAQAVDIAAQIKRKYEEEMGKVQNRLPLSLGLVFFPRKTPLAAVLEAGRRMEEGRMENEEWRITKTPQNDGKTVTLDLAREGQRITLQVPIVMGDRMTEDVWYPYFELVGTPAAHHTYRFDYNGKPWVHVKTLQVGETVRVTPSHFAYIFLEHTAQRFRFDPARDVQYLDELPRLAKMWQTLRDDTPNMSDTKLQAIWALFRSKWALWRLDDKDEADYAERQATFKQLVKTTFERDKITGITPEDVVNGRFDRCLNLYHHILKERVKQQEA